MIAAHTQKFPLADAPTLQFEAKPYETFDESADLYKDGSVVLVPLRGHTPGKTFFPAGSILDCDAVVQRKNRYHDYPHRYFLWLTKIAPRR